MAENTSDSSGQIKTTESMSKQPSMENMNNAGAVDANEKQNRPYITQKVRSESVEERESRLKMLREKQNEERQRKLEELKAQALAAQRFRELKEEERRRRIEELRLRDNDRRQQAPILRRCPALNYLKPGNPSSVGERKRLIYEAERDRRESILKKNMEREARFEMKKRNERSSLAFAFGSSTPRMLEPADTGGSFWGHRRATSTTNIMFPAVPLTRRSSERELDGSKKRATSAGGLDRNAADGNGETIPAGCASGHVGRRRTDLMPTIPTRDSSAPTRKPFTKSPGRTYSLSRLDQLAKPRKPLPIVQEKPPEPKQSSSNIKSMSRSMGHLAGRFVVAPCGRASPPQRPLRKADSKSMHQLSVAAPVPPPRSTRAVLLRKRAIESPPEGPSRPDSSLSHQSTSSVHSSVTMRSRPVAAPRKPRPASIAVTGVTHDSNRNPLSDAKKAELSKPPLPRTRKSSVGKVAAERAAKLSKTSPKTTPKVTPLQSPCTEAPSVGPTTSIHPLPVTAPASAQEVLLPVNTQPATQPPSVESTEIKELKIDEQASEVETQPEILKPELTPVKAVPAQEAVPEEPAISKPVVQEQAPPAVQPSEESNIIDTTDMTASMMAKVRITTEEEAKAALAERRRLAREEAERQAEAERLRIEAEFLAEQERQRQEEEQARIMVEQQRHAEEERLAQAIKETQKREEEERLRREEELKQKLEKEEQERKAREESEKQRIEMQKRLEQEEKEREARRKRVEAIMLRTRAKGSPGNNQTKDENSSSEKGSNDVNNKPTIESYEKEVNEKEAALFNGSFKNQPSVISKENGENGEAQHSNGHQNGVNVSEDFSKVNQTLIELNVTNTLIDIGELDPFKNANTSLDLPAEKITNEDTVNSNNPTESHSATDFLL